MVSNKVPMHIEVVVGANYGDEGKGLVTEFLCRRLESPVVVLSNGGCQRGHTVHNYEKHIKHVFHHFGSGTFIGAPTIFSKTYLLNPITFNKESIELAKHGLHPVCARAPGCVLQLPVDMFINQQLEKHRSKFGVEHGSCGWGIWETHVRNSQRHDGPLTFEEFIAMDNASKKKVYLDETDRSVESRLCGIDFDKATLDVIRSAAFIEHFLFDASYMQAQVTRLSSDDVVEAMHGTCYKNIVVENAQGLLLDKHYAPPDKHGRTDIHSTPSNTSLMGAIESLASNYVDHDDIKANYVSRSYMTRHGAGPFPEFNAKLSFNDCTNVFNDY